ncbi:MAG: beta strand repeat-containing protein [Bacillota bacterium]
MSFMKKLTSALVASSLVLGLVTTSFAATAEDVNLAFNRLSHYGIVQGVYDPATGETSPKLGDPVTRAQLLTILVRAWGQEDTAKLLTGAPTGFSDVDGVEGVNWASGYIYIGNAIAKQNGGQELGVGGGMFNPGGALTGIEVLAFTMKFLGLQVGSGANWVADTIAAAKDAGLISDADEQNYLANPTAAVNRGQAFALLDALFAGYNKLEGGKTVYQTIDNEGPALTVNEVEAATDMPEITLTGTVSDAAELYVGSEMVAFEADGNFTATVALELGANDIIVTAVDWVGNATEETVSVTRNPGAAAKIAVEVPAEVKAGETVDVAIKVFDANDVELEVAAADITVTVGGEVGTYADGKFTAAEKVGTGTLTVSYGDLTPATADVAVVAGPLAKLMADKSSVAKGGTIKLTPTDEFGNAVSGSVTYEWAANNEDTDASGIAVTSGGIVYTAEPGSYKITATGADGSAEVVVGVYSTTIAGLRVTTAESIVANNTSRVAVEVAAVDAHGNVVGSATNTVNFTGTGVAFFEKADTSDNAPGNSVTLKDGMATVYVAVNTYMAGEQVTINAVDSVTSTIKGSTKLSAVAAVATSLKVTAPKFLAANAVNTADITVKVVDQAGVAVPGVYTVSGSVTGPAKITVPSSGNATYSAGGDASFTISNVENVGVEGTITFTATVEGVGSATATVSHTIAGNPAKFGVTAAKDSIASSSTAMVKYTVELQDRNGVPLKATDVGGVALTISMPTTYAGKFLVSPDGATTAANVDGKWTNITLANGQSTATFYVHVNGKYTGDVAVTVEGTAAGVKVAGSDNFAVTPGSVRFVAIDRSSITAPVAEPKATYVASLTDVWGNTVASADVELSVYAVDTSSNSAANITVNGKNADASNKLTVKTNAEGKATLQLEARPYAPESYTLVVNYTNTDAGINDTKSATFAIENVTVATMSSKIVRYTNNTYITTPNGIVAGEAYYFVVSVKDNYGGAMSGIANDLSLEIPADVVGQTANGDLYTEAEITAGIPFADHTTAPAGLGLVAGDYWVMVYGGKAGLVNLTAKYSDVQTAVTTAATAVVNAGQIAKITVNGGKDIEVEGISTVHGPYTLALTDAFGNTVTLNSNHTVTITAPTNVTLRAEAGGATVTSLSTRSTTSFYFVATVANASPGYTVNFSVDVDVDADGTLEVGETFTGTAVLKVSQ